MPTQRTAACDVDDFKEALSRRLEPDAAHALLARIGFAAITYELLKGEIVEGLRSFFSWPDDTGELLPDEEYQTQVLSRDKNVYRASCLWLVEHMESFTLEDLDVLTRLHEQRGQAVHKGGYYFFNPEDDVDIELVRDAVDIVRRVGQFWGRINIEINSEFDDQEIADHEIRSGASMLCDMLLWVVK